MCVHFTRSKRYDLIFAASELAKAQKYLHAATAAAADVVRVTTVLWTRLHL